MHDAVFLLAIVWLTVLTGAMIVVAGLTSGAGRRLVAFDAVSYLLVAAFAVIAIHRGESGFLDIALAIAAISFVQALAVSRLAVGREATL